MMEKQFKSGDRFIIPLFTRDNKFPDSDIKFPIIQDHSSFIVYSKKLKLIELTSPLSWFYLTNDKDNGISTSIFSINKNISDGFWKKVEEFPDKFKIHSKYNVYSGVLNDGGRNFGKGTFIIEREPMALNYTIYCTNSYNRFEVSWDKITHKIQIGEWVIK